MRSLVVALMMAACGGETGLLLDVDPGADSGVTSVEIFVAKDKAASRMGMPPAASTRATQGDVYAVIDHSNVAVGADGHAQILLQRGSLTEIPALLVLGLDANHTPVRYAVVIDPAGPIALPATKETKLVVDLDPASPTTIANARTPGGNPGIRIARWSKRGGDDPAGSCVAVLHDMNTTVGGTFFGPDGDTDCDGAMPECDDAWFLRVQNPGKCGTTVPPITDDTMNACRVGDTAGCKDGVASSADQCTAQPTAICMPLEVCDQCASDLDPNCVAQQLTDPNTAHIECTLFVHEETAGMPTMCSNRGVMLSMGAQFGNGFTCTGSGGFVNVMMPNGTAAATLRVTPSPDATLTFGCHAQTTDFGFDVVDPTSSPVDPQLPDTQGALAFGVSNPSGTTAPRLLVLPITVHTVSLGGQTCPSNGMTCALKPDGTVQQDPLWHCAGS